MAALEEVCLGEGSAVPELDPRAAIVVVNETNGALWTFNARAHDSGSWGDDFVEGAILPGERRSWTLIPGTYHLRAEAANGEQVHHFGLRVPAGKAVRWTLRDG